MDPEKLQASARPPLQLTQVRIAISRLFFEDVKKWEAGMGTVLLVFDATKFLSEHIEPSDFSEGL